MGEHLIFGAIGFFLGGITGGYFAGRYFSKEFKSRIEDLENENRELRDELRGKAEKKMQEREKAVEKAEKKLDKSLETIGERPDTATIEKLSEQYRSDAFDAHFADRACPDDSDDVGEEDEEDGEGGESDEDHPRKTVLTGEEAYGELTKEQKRALRKNGYLQTGDGRTLMTKAFAEAYVKMTDSLDGSESLLGDRSTWSDDPFADVVSRRMTDKEAKAAAEENERELVVEMIDVERFKKDIQVKDCSTYTYYQEDGVLVDDITQEVEPDQEGILGKEAMELIDQTQLDALYINNEPDDMLYEIVVDHNMGYYRDVLGF